MQQKILDLLATAGALRYGSEAVNQLEHALQCAMHAERTGGPASLITAALVHDIGHLVGPGDEGAAAMGVDMQHENVAAHWLVNHFPPEVTEPVRLHVAAKRYLCFAEPAYWAGLSPASRESLDVQGGAFSAGEADHFMRLPFAAEAIWLRRFDDAAKSPKLKTPDLAHFSTYISQTLLA